MIFVRDHCLKFELQCRVNQLLYIESFFYFILFFIFLFFFFIFILFYFFFFWWCFFFFFLLYFQNSGLQLLFPINKIVSSIAKQYCLRSCIIHESNAVGL